MVSLALNGNDRETLHVVKHTPFEFVGRDGCRHVKVITTASVNLLYRMTRALVEYTLLL